MFELVDKGIKLIITVFYVFKEIDERLNMLRRDIKDI